MKVQLSFANQADPDRILAIVCDARGIELEKTSAGWQGWVAKIRQDLAHYRLLSVDGRLVGVCKTLKRWLRVGRGRIVCGEVDWPCIAKACQRQGLGRALVLDALDWMRADGVGVSRVTPSIVELAEFYHQLGYVTFPSRSVELGLHQPVEEKTSLGACIRQFDPQTDLEECVRLCDDFDRGYMGSLVWTGKCQAWTNSFSLVFEGDDKILGFLRADSSFGQVAFDRDHPEVFDALIRRVYNEALSKELTELKMKLPYDPALFDILMDAQLSFRAVAIVSG